jgi:hypothetical protein
MGKFVMLISEPLAQGFIEGLRLFWAIISAPFRPVFSFVVHRNRNADGKAHPVH